MKALERYLESFGKNVVNKSKGILQKKKKVSSGALLNSLKFNVLKTNNGYKVDFSMLDYGEYVDKGVSGAGGEIKTGKNKGTYTGERSYVH